MVNLALLLIRLVVGLTLAAHGAQKVFGWFGGPGLHGFRGMLDQMNLRPARMWALTGALAELLGGLLVVLGLLGPIGPALGSGAMLVAILGVHWPKGFFAQRGGFELPLLILGCLVAFAIGGFGYWSLDQAIGLRIPEPASGLAAFIAVAGGALVSLATRGMTWERRRRTV